MHVLVIMAGGSSYTLEHWLDWRARPPASLGGDFRHYTQQLPLSSHGKSVAHCDALTPAPLTAAVYQQQQQQQDGGY